MQLRVVIGSMAKHEIKKKLDLPRANLVKGNLRRGNDSTDRREIPNIIWRTVQCLLPSLIGSAIFIPIYRRPSGVGFMKKGELIPSLNTP